MFGALYYKRWMLFYLYDIMCFGIIITGEVPEDPRNVIVSKLSLVADGRIDIELDLTGDLTKLKEKVFVIKEGAKYRIKVSFYVQREIVTGLRYEQNVSMKRISVNSILMVGSYAPSEEEYNFFTIVDEAFSGLLARDSYSVHSKFTDDEKNIYLEWDWKFKIKKELDSEN